MDDRGRQLHRISFLEGSTGEEVEMLAKALSDRQVVIAPAALAKLLSLSGLCSAATRNLVKWC
jgi:hypothetical protein